MIGTKDDREGCRSLVCDSNGIIIAEMVYRCMICASVSDSICEAQRHYQIKHIDTETGSGGGGGGVSGLTGSSSPNSGLVKEEEEDVTGEDEDEERVPGRNGKGAIMSVAHPWEINKRMSENGNELILDPGDDLQDEEDELEDDDEDEEGHGGAGGVGRSRQALANYPADGMNGQGGAARGGYVTCAVCNVTKFYASVQRRYGQFTCMGCAKFFGRFLIKPKKYYCPSLGSCPLDASPRCKACLLQACIETYHIDDKRMKIINANKPQKKIGISRSPVKNGSSPSIFPPGRNRRPVGRPTATGVRVTTASPHANGTANSNTGTNSAVLALLRSTGKKNWGCRKCTGCLVEDCGKCNYCLDKPKFGGPNTLKKKCIRRKCLVQERGKGHELSRMSV